LLVDLKNNLKEFPYSNLEKIGDLIYFEGSILSHFTDESGQNLLFYWVDTDALYNRWLVIKVIEDDLIDYLNKLITLNDILNKSNKDFVLVVDVDENAVFKNTFICSTNKLEKKYIPEDKVYSFEIPENYLLYIKNHKKG